MAGHAAIDGVFGGMTSLVRQIQGNNSEAMLWLYGVFSEEVNVHFRWRFGIQDANDITHEAFIEVLEAIRGGKIREPERLMGFIRTVVRRKSAGQIRRNIKIRKHLSDGDFTMRYPDARKTPEEIVVALERVELARVVLRDLSSVDHEILVRFYLWEQPICQICNEMALTETQVRVRKSRAKDRFGRLGRKRLVG